MSVERSFIGREYPPTEPYRVSREKIREFADAVNDPNPAYRSVDVARSLGHRDVVAPPTFPTVIAMPASRVFMFDPAMGIDYSRVVHGEQRFVYERPVFAGDELTATVRIDDVRNGGGNDLITSSTRMCTPAGELVVTGYSVTVVRAATS